MKEFKKYDRSNLFIVAVIAMMSVLTGCSSEDDNFVESDLKIRSQYSHSNLDMGNDPDSRPKVRISAITQVSGDYGVAEIRIIAPKTTTIYIGKSPNGVITYPLFLDNENRMLVDFDISKPMGGDSRFPKKMKVTNSMGYDKVMSFSPKMHFRDMIPINPDETTVISIILLP